MKILGRGAPAWLGYGVLACALASAVGCSSVAGNKVFLNYALYDYGADITAAGQNGSRTADSLINGVADSAAWEDGEGWEYTFKRTEVRDIGGQTRGGVEYRIAQGAAWAHVKFAEPSVINRVVVTALDSEDMRFPGYKGADLQAYDSKDSFSPWKTVARIDQGQVVVPGRQSAPSGPVTTFRFNPIEAEGIRFIIYTMLDSKTLQAENNYERERGATRDQPARQNYVRITRGQETTIRLLEIEATGTEAVEIVAPREATEAANILLQDLTGPTPSETEQR